jgi:plasmid stability protein
VLDALQGPVPVSAVVHSGVVQPRAYTSLTYTFKMAMTTIRVEAEVRDQLAARAEAHGRSLGAELRAMLDEMVWQGIEAGYRRLAARNEEMAAYQAEAATWTSANLDDLAATAADEYPEYNS